MQIRNKINGGLVTVSEEYGKRLLASGEYEAVSAPKRAPKKAVKQED